MTTLSTVVNELDHDNELAALELAARPTSLNRMVNPWTLRGTARQLTC
jgi:hypothetical protein